jgi:hypothetical protein
MEAIIKTQTEILELKITHRKNKNIIEVTNSRIDQTEEKIIELKDSLFENT